MKIRNIVLKDFDFGSRWKDEVEKKGWVYDDFMKSPDWRENWISFDCVLYDSRTDRVYCGITSFSGDIFKAYDCRSNTFIDLGYDRVRAPYDAKFHRSLLHGDDGRIYGAVALLHCIDHYYEAPGGAVVAYDPDSGSIEKLGIPVPHTYIQSLIIDWKKRTAYGLGFAPQCLLKFNLDTREGRMIAPITSGYGGGVMSENIVQDDQGCVWSNWGLTRAWAYSVGPDAFRLCKYDPGQDRMIFYQRGLPGDRPGETAMAESFFNFGDGFIYAGGNNGSLYRIDPVTAEAEKICVPVTGRRSRLTSLVQLDRERVAGIFGRDGQCELFIIDLKSGAFESCGPIVSVDGMTLWQCHDLTMTGDGRLYAGENDNPTRSSRLWEISEWL